MNTGLDPATGQEQQSNTVELQHPLVRHYLSRLRDVATPPAEFRQLIQRLSAILAYEATRDLAERSIEVQTPLCTTTGNTLAQRIALVPILRAGLGMVDPVLGMIPHAEVWHLGIYRDEQTMQPVEYYSKLPSTEPVDVAFVLDPMLATGGSVLAAIATLGDWGVTNLKVLSVIASNEGIRVVTEKNPHIQLYVAAIDAELNDHKYIVPGLGDAGDRSFNTVPRH
jgi:uracil phosphoribosyltransferase